MDGLHEYTNFAVVLMVLGLLSVGAAGDHKTVPGSNVVSTPGTPNHHKEVRYEYRYAVDDPLSGVVSARWEHRLGEYVKGAYSLLEPDGKVRTVDYEVDGDKGFHAVIRTSPPANSLLSNEQLTKSRQIHKDPPVNVLTNRPRETGQRTGRVLPINFHSVKPDYYLAFAKGESGNSRSNEPILEAPVIGPPPPPLPPAAAVSTHAVHAAGPSHHEHDLGHAVHGHKHAAYPAEFPSPGSSYYTMRVYVPGDGETTQPNRPSPQVLPPVHLTGHYHPLHTQVIFTPYAADYFGG